MAVRTEADVDADQLRQMRRKHIFAVNGASDFLNVVRDLLEDESYNVTTTNFVPRTFEQIAALEPSLLIIDLAIHGDAGWDMLERLRADVLTYGIPVIVVSTDASLLERVQADQPRYGGQRFLSKPFDIEVLLRAVDELIGAA